MRVSSVTETLIVLMGVTNFRYLLRRSGIQFREGGGVDGGFAGFVRLIVPIIRLSI